MNTIVLVWLFGAVTTFGLFLQLGQFFKQYILTWGQNVLFWLFWGCLWVATTFAALLAGALF